MTKYKYKIGNKVLYQNAFFFTKIGFITDRKREYSEALKKDRAYYKIDNIWRLEKDILRLLTTFKQSF